MSSYSKANRTAQWYDDKFGWGVFAPNCGVIHTTEGFDWPDYSGGSMAPNYTARPNFLTQSLDFRAHFEDEHSSRALVNQPGGVETNTSGDVQIELIGTCDPANSKTWFGKVANKEYIYWPTAPDWALRAVAEFLVDMYKRHGIQLTSPVSAWNAYPASAGFNAPQRLSFDQWRKFYGWCGHQHVPENDHGDPGAFPMAKVIQFAKDLLNPPKTAPASAPAAPAPAPTINAEVEVSHQTFTGPQQYIPIVVPHDGREYQIDISFSRGSDDLRNINLMTFKRQPTVGTESAVVRNLSWKWKRDVPGTITLGGTEGHLSLSFDGTSDQMLSVSLTPTGKSVAK